MKPKEQIFDDIARVAGDAVSLFSGMTRQVKDEIRARVDELATRMDLVPREDFERLEAMLAETRRKVDALEKELGKPKKAAQGKKGSKGKKKNESGTR
jgi:BMFP domain-containing protein YqiC